MQFVISTHSPAIISNLHNDGKINRIYRLNQDHQAELVDDYFGAEYGDTLVMSMGSYGRLHELELLEELYREYRCQNNEEGKRQVMDDLRRLFLPSRMAETWMRDTVAKWEEKLRQ